MTIDVKTEQMIELVLQINGYAKPDDLHSLPADQRAVALRAYYQDHTGNSALHWQGEQLWTGPQAPDTSFFADSPVQESPASIASDPVPVAADFGSGAPASVSVPAYGGPDAFGDLSPAAYPAAAAVATLEPTTPASAYGQPYASQPVAVEPPLSAEPLVAESQTYVPAVDAALGTDFMPDSLGTSPAMIMPSESPVSPWWWVLAILWAPLGGVVAYFVTKEANPHGAARLLKVSLLVWGASILVGIALGVMPMLLLR